MTKLTDDEVRHIAKLCRLNLTDAEVEKFGGELSTILDYIDKLQEVDTTKVEATAQVTGLTNQFRDDEIVTDGPEPKELLGQSPLPILENQIQTPSAHG